MPDLIKKSTLRNGLRVITAERRGSHVVSMQFWAGVGSANESTDQAGTAHFIEHMLFKGTEKRGLGKIAEAIEGCGGEINAYTSFDQTVFYTTMASRYYDIGLETLSDAILRSKFEPCEIEKEREVILEEIKRSDDNPSSVLDRMLFATAYKIHNYKRPIIGFDHVVKRLKREDLLAFKNRWYVANNCFLVATGDFETGQFLKQAESLFLDLPSADLSGYKSPVEVPQEMVRIRMEPASVEETYMAYAFPIPQFAHPDVAVLDVIDIIAGQGESSRLYSELKLGKNIVNTICAGSLSPKDPGLFMVSAELDAKTYDEALKDSFRIIQHLKHVPVAAAELEKAKTIVESQIIHEIETVQGLANKLGSYEMFAGDISYEDKYLKLLMSTTVQDIQRTAKKYFDFNKLSLATIFPRRDLSYFDKTALAQTIRSFEDESAVHGGFREKVHVPKSPSPDREIIRRILPNGTTLILKENKQIDLVSACFVFKGGSRYENENNSGVSNFMTNMLVRGTKSLNAHAVAEFFESRGSSVRPFSGKNTFGLRFTGLSRCFEETFDMMIETICFPAFDYDEIQKERRSIMEILKTQEDDLPTVAFNSFSRQLYGDHPYGLNVLGDQRTVTNLSRGEIVSFYERYAQAANLTLAVVGNINADEWIPKIENKLKTLRSSKVAAPILPLIKPLTSIRKEVIHKDKQQAHLVLGFPGITFDNPDRFVLEVLNSIFSSMSGRLFTELRDKGSLCYAVSSICQEGIDPGYVAFYMGTSRSKIEDAIGGIINEIRRSIEEPPAAEELERVQRYIVGNHEIALQRNDAQASYYAFNDKYGRSLDDMRRFPEKILAVTAEDVQRVARTLLNTENYVLTIVRPKD